MFKGPYRCNPHVRVDVKDGITQRAISEVRKIAETRHLHSHNRAAQLLLRCGQSLQSGAAGVAGYGNQLCSECEFPLA
jgi:hypothetical protein